MDNLQRRLNSGAQQRTFAAWMQFARDTLRDAGWPGNRPAYAADAQTLRAWDHLLDLVATLDVRDERVSFTAALDALALAAAGAPSCSADSSAPIQILSFAEAGPTLALGSFDAAVVLHATDQNWPPPERIHPLLSWALQQSLSMPGTDASQTAARAQRLTTTLLAATPTTLCSFARETADGLQRLSPLIAAHNLNAAPPENNPTPAPWLQPEILEDTTPLPALPSTHVTGGATVLQLQAACGFRAFAQVRLASTELSRQQLGFDPMQNGNVVHLAMQHFWDDVRSHAELAALPPEECVKKLNAAIDYALSKQPAAVVDWDKAFLALQRTRLLRLLQRWLEVELKRGPFTVQDSEEEREVHVGPLTLSVRLDRIDAVTGPDGETGVALIDYKSGGTASPSDWRLPRPEEPQLPLYTLLYPPEEVKAVAFARVRAGTHMKWLGYAADKSILPDVRRDNPDDLAAQIAAWRVELEQLAEDFAAGRAGVSPKSYPATCKHCGQLLLCRLDAARLTPAHEEDADGGSDD
jgi:probable DNA repair protein